MRIPRFAFRIRLRTLLILVALAALTLGGWQMSKRREYCLKWAEFDGRLLILAGSCIDQNDPTDPGGWRQISARIREEIARYRHVADHPWLPLPREPEPE